MKELSIEEKARRYDEVVNKLKGFMAQGVDPLITRADVQDFFPELKESEDEKIRKSLIELVKQSCDVLYPPNQKAMLVWLEKQGGHAKFINGILVGDKVTRNEDGVLVNLSQLKRVAKPADKVEPKFKVGDWITNGKLLVGQVTSFNGEYYHYMCDGLEQPLHVSSAYRWHLWTIQDAKDGDVLQLGSFTVIFQEYIGDRNCKCYCSVYNGEFEIPSQADDDNIYGCYNAIPATKEQRDLLFQKMKEAGYEWDAEKKELKKIEQKPVIPKFRVGDIITDDTGVFPHKKIEAIENENYIVRCLYTNNQQCIPINAQDEYMLVNQKPAWSEEDERQCNNIISLVEGKAIMRKDIKGFVNWLKSLKNKFFKLNKWNEEDEALIEPIIEFLETGDIYNTTISSMTLWLKSLKERVLPQPNKEWSEDDENHLDSIIDTLKDYIKDKQDMRALVGVTQDNISWLKSLRPQNRWKPSDEQMKILNEVLKFAANHENPYWNDYIFGTLSYLIRQLRKLKEE